MWKIRKGIIITNNDWVRDKYKVMMRIIYLETYEEVLKKARDLVYDGHDLLTHPQASGQKANQTPYRSVIVHPGDGEDNKNDSELIDKCLETYYQWQKIEPNPGKYTDRVKRDFKVMDASMMDSIIPRIFHLGTG